MPMDLENVGTHDATATHGDQDVSNDLSCEDVCAIAWKGYKAGKGARKKGPHGAGLWYRGNGADEWTSSKKDEVEKRREARKAPRAANSIGTATKTKGPAGTKAKGKAKARAVLDIAAIAVCRSTWE